MCVHHTLRRRTTEDEETVSCSSQAAIISTPAAAPCPVHAKTVNVHYSVYNRGISLTCVGLGDVVDAYNRIPA